MPYCLAWLDVIEDKIIQNATALPDVLAELGIYFCLGEPKISQTTEPQRFCFQQYEGVVSTLSLTYFLSNSDKA
jgi:hypothetical protein